MRTSCSSAVIAELLSTFAHHRTATLTSLNPVFAFGALFELRSFDKVYELLIVFIETFVHFVLRTAHSGMILASAFQTVVFMAVWATIIVQGFIEFKNCRASCCWAPRNASSVRLDVFVKSEFQIFFFEFSIDIGHNVACLHLLLAGLRRTPDIEIASLDLSL